VTRIRLSRIFWIGAAAILIAAALVALGAVLRGSFSDDDSRILVTLGGLLYTGGAALTGLALVERGPARLLGWGVVAAAPVCFALITWAVWSFAFEGEGNETADKLAWSAVIITLAGLIATTALLVARSRNALALATVAGALGSITAALSVYAFWGDASSDAYPKVVGVLVILTVLCFFLVPVVQRYTSAAAPAGVRVLGVLGDVELVAVHGHVEGVAVQAPGRGERLVLRHRG